MIGALLRAVPRAPIVLLTGSAVVGVVTVSRVAGADGALVAVQASTVALAGAAVTLIHEPRGVLDAVPTRLARRRTLLLAAGVPPLALVWLGLLALAGVDGDYVAALTLQLATVTSLALAAGARGGDPAASLAAVAIAFGAGRILFGPQFFPAGMETARWWLAAGCAGLLWLAAFSRD